jgi:hypothetical protein
MLSRVKFLVPEGLSINIQRTLFAQGYKWSSNNTEVKFDKIGSLFIDETHRLAFSSKDTLHNNNYGDYNKYTEINRDQFLYNVADFCVGDDVSILKPNGDVHDRFIITKIDKDLHTWPAIGKGYDLQNKVNDFQIIINKKTEETNEKIRTNHEHVGATVGGNRSDIQIGGCGEGLSASNRERRERSCNFGERPAIKGEGLHTWRRPTRTIEF